MRFQGPIVLLMSCLLGSVHAMPSWAEPLASAASPGLLCRVAIAAAEQASAIPPQLLSAIGRVESGRRDPVSGVVAPWPWTINAEGQGSFFDTKAQAIAAVRVLQARGVQSIDVGCMQVNLMYHPGAFASLDLAFDPTANAVYAARFLNDLHAQTNDWPRADGQYHSATPALADAYQTKVAAAWTEERHLAGGPLAFASAGGPSAGPASPGGAVAASPASPGGVPHAAGGGFRGGVPATISHAAASVGRDLAAYRTAPIMFATRGPMVQRQN